MFPFETGLDLVEIKGTVGPRAEGCIYRAPFSDVHSLVPEFLSVIKNKRCARRVNMRDLGVLGDHWRNKIDWGKKHKRTDYQTGFKQTPLSHLAYAARTH